LCKFNHLRAKVRCQPRWPVWHLYSCHLTLYRRNGNVYVTISSVNYLIKELLLADGDSPFAAWFGSLEAVAAAKVSVAVSRMEQGNLSNVEWFRGIGEYKID
jgi:hypothetical protein